METNFNFKSQPATSRKQSERLLKLGLKKETADMTIMINEDSSWHIEAKPYTSWQGDMEYYPIGIPAWSLHRLIHLVFNNGCARVDFYDDEDPYEILICKIEMRIKEGYFNEEYLCQE